MLNKIKIVKLFRELLFMVYRGKEKKYYQLKLKKVVLKKELKKVKA